MAFILRGWQPRNKERPEAFELMLPDGSVPSPREQSLYSFLHRPQRLHLSLRLEPPVSKTSCNPSYDNDTHYCSMTNGRDTRIVIGRRVWSSCCDASDIMTDHWLWARHMDHGKNRWSL